jgi:hypothetical protein
MTIDVETRLSRAAQVLDEHIERPATGPAYVAAAARPSHRRPLLVSIVAFGCVLALVAAVMYARTDDSTTVSSAPIGEGWTALPDAPIEWRFQHLAVSTGNGLFIWGGYTGRDNKSDGAYLDSTTNTWRKLPRAPLAADRGDAIGVWTGREVVVLNGVDEVRAAAFDPVAFTWRELPDPPLANAANAMNRAFFVDGAVIVIGVATEGDGKAPSQVARLDLATSKWTPLANPPVEFSSFFEAASTGEEIIVVGHRPNMKDEGCGSMLLAYRPSANTWREIPAGPAADRLSLIVVWTGTELFVGGGRMCDDAREPSRSADLLDPVTGVWRHASEAPIGFEDSGRYEDIWTGRSVATVNQHGAPVLFNPATNAWHVGATSRAESSIGDTPFVWVGDSIMIWSGGVTNGPTCCEVVEGGVAYTPPPGF